MFFKSVHILGIITSVIAAYRDEDSVERRYGDREIESIRLNSRIKENRNQLKRIIKYLNGRYDDTDERKTENNPEMENDNLVDEQEARILAALSLLQKNYNYQLRHGNDHRVKPRLVYIENPEVLQEFKSNLRSYDSTTSWESSDDGSEFDRILRDELSGHRKFDIIGPSQDKNANKPHGHGHQRGHKNRNLNRGEAELRNGNSFKNNHPKGRFKITSDKRNGPNAEGKRKKPLERNRDDQRQKLVSEEHLDDSNKKYNRIEKKAVNLVLKEFTKDRNVPIRPKYVENKYSREDLWDKGIKDKEPYKRKRPKEHLKKWDLRNPQSLGRTFIPYIATKTVYEDDD